MYISVLVHTLIIGQRQCMLGTLDQILMGKVTLKTMIIEGCGSAVGNEE